jgi:hypothetical protein
MEFFRTQVYPVAEALIVLHQEEGNDLDAVGTDDLLRQVTRGIGDDPHGTPRQRKVPVSCTFGDGVLGLHILRLMRHQVAHRLQVCENRFGVIGVHMNLQHIAGGDDDDGIAFSPQPLLHGFSIRE